MRRYFFVIYMFVFFGEAIGQYDILDNYVNQGLKNNLALKQKYFSLEKSMQTLKEARGMFLPVIGIEARYSRAGGGRMIDIPVGDLVNPIYNTLNDMLISIGQPPAFPTGLPNERIPFLRSREHETKIRVMQPIFTPANYYNYRLKANLKSIQENETEIFKQQLVADIKKAYFDYLKASQVVVIYDKTFHLLEENLRVSEKLFQNQKVTLDVVFRARAEIAAIQQKQVEAQKNMKLTAAYFNFLLNRPFDTSIEKIDIEEMNYEQSLNLQAATDKALQKRLEFRQLEHAVKAARNGMNISTASFLPNLIGVFDYGFQGEEYKFAKDDDFWMASAVLQWNLFKGGQDKARYQQSAAEKNRLETQLLELNMQVMLQVHEAHDNVIVAQKSIVTARERMNSAEKSFAIINKKYEQGMIPHIEFIDARTNLTGAELSYTIAQYDYQVNYAEFLRVIGGS